LRMVQISLAPATSARAPFDSVAARASIQALPPD
jgi:hypothetical protein